MKYPLILIRTLIIVSINGYIITTGHTGHDAAIQHDLERFGKEWHEDGNDFHINPAMRLALGKGHQFGASQPVMSRLENDILGTAAGQEALDAMITRLHNRFISKWAKTDQGNISRCRSLD